MDNSDVAHKWANQIKESGRGSSFYFEGPTIYSYGRHFIVGHLVTTKGGARCALMNNGRYSVTTAKHQAYARYALHGLPGVRVFNVTKPEEGAAAVEANRCDYLARIEAARAALMSTRKYTAERERALIEVLNEAAEYCRLFPLKGNMYKDGHKAGRAILAAAAAAEAGTLISAKDRAAIEAKAAAARVQAAKARKEREERTAADLKEAETKLIQWVAGVPDVPAPAYWGNTAGLPTRLRIKGAAVETSRGAVVSVRAARVLWHAIRAGRDIVGAEVDGYTVTNWNGTLKIGCHTIERAEVERVGALLDARDVSAVDGETGDGI